MVGDGGRTQVQRRRQLLPTLAPVGQQPHDPEPGTVGQRLEKLHDLRKGLGLVLDRSHGLPPDRRTSVR